MLPNEITAKVDAVLEHKRKTIPQVVREKQQAALAEFNERGMATSNPAFVGIRDNLLKLIEEWYRDTWDRLKARIEVDELNYYRKLEKDIWLYFEDKLVLRDLMKVCCQQLDQDRKKIFRNEEVLKQVTLDDGITTLKNDLDHEIATFTAQMKSERRQSSFNFSRLIIGIVGVVVAVVSAVVAIVTFISSCT